MAAILEPCPNCGGKAGIYLKFDYPPLWAVACVKCGIEPPFTSSSYDAAVNGWKRRSFLEMWRKPQPDEPGHNIVLEKEAEGCDG